MRKLGVFTHGHEPRREALMLCSCHCTELLHAGQLTRDKTIYIRNP
jgi:hypothetical protein